MSIWFLTVKAGMTDAARLAHRFSQHKQRRNGSSVFRNTTCGALRVATTGDSRAPGSVGFGCSHIGPGDSIGTTHDVRSCHVVRGVSMIAGRGRTRRTARHIDGDRDTRRASSRANG